MTLTVDDDVCMISGKEEPYHPDSKSQTTKVKQVIKDTEQFNFVTNTIKTTNSSQLISYQNHYKSFNA